MSFDRRVGVFVVLGLIGFFSGIQYADHHVLVAFDEQAKNAAQADVPDAISSMHSDPAIQQELYRAMAHRVADIARQKGIRQRIRDNLGLYLVTGAVGLGVGCLVAAFASQMFSQADVVQCK